MFCKSKTENLYFHLHCSRQKKCISKVLGKERKSIQGTLGQPLAWAMYTLDDKPVAQVAKTSSWDCVPAPWPPLDRISKAILVTAFL